uniref:Uncharacterized protein n=1 Tax=Arundo donax TaxID=35708 RepID=A0A0A9BA80_ARUDO
MATSSYNMALQHHSTQIAQIQSLQISIPSV